MKPEKLAFLIQRRHDRAALVRRKSSGRAAPFLAGAAAVLLVFMSALILVGGLFYADLTRELPPPQTLENLLDTQNGEVIQPTRIYDRSGEHLLLTLENPGLPHSYLPVSEKAAVHISPLLVRIMISQEDPGFWDHSGAGFGSLFDPAPRTIAEKLVDRLLLTREENGWRRALRMRLLALQITAMYGREKILEWHLNSSYFGHLAYGVDTAAKLYFEKTSADLTAGEAALLAEIYRAPALNPLQAPAAADGLRETSLSRLLLAGVITPEEYLAAGEEEIHLRAAMGAPASEAPAFTNYLLSQLENVIGSERLELGGLKVFSTLDNDLQTNLLCTLEAQIGRLTEQASAENSTCPAAGLLPTLPPAQKPYLAGVMAGGVMLDPQTGDILAMSGIVNLEGETDSDSGMRSGSIFTPLAALSAFTRGMGPATLMWDLPNGLPDELAAFRQKDATYQGPIRLRTALGNDLLTPLTGLLLLLGPQDVYRQAAPLGLTGFAAEEIEPDFFFQGEETSLMQVAQVYSAFAGLGRVSGLSIRGEQEYEPAAVRSISAVDGRVLWDGEERGSKEVVSPPLAYLIHNILADEDARRINLGYPNALEIGRPAGAKTGSAGGGSEAWAVGYTPQRLAVIWIGLPEGSEPGGTVDVRPSAGVWHALMQHALRGLPAMDWSLPTGVVQAEVCEPSGLLPGEDCPTIVREVFLSGTEPTSVDTLYKKMSVNRETGHIATVFTPPDMVEDRVFINYPREAREWALANGLAVVPEDYDVIQAPASTPGVSITHPGAFGYVHGRVEIVGTASGDGFGSYSLQIGEGLNPAGWQQIGEESRQRVEGGRLGIWDTEGMNGLYAIRLMMVREDKKVFTAVVQVSVDNIPPVVTVPYPVDGQEFNSASAASVTFQAEASDLIGIKKVEWVVDGQPVGERLAEPFSLPWAVVPGEHTLAIRAYDLAGNVAETPAVRIMVR